MAHWDFSYTKPCFLSLVHASWSGRRELQIRDCDGSKRQEWISNAFSLTPEPTSEPTITSAPTTTMSPTTLAPTPSGMPGRIKIWQDRSICCESDSSQVVSPFSPFSACLFAFDPTLILNMKLSLLSGISGFVRPLLGYRALLGLLGAYRRIH